ncbi:unnamed protein product [Trichobilharzia regenti]|nr:unnamed protein product [Trichobilharzia regenti]
MHRCILTLKKNYSSPNSATNFITSLNSLKLKQIPDTNSPGNRFLSPWLSWSHNSSTPNNLDDSSLITSDTLLKDNDLISEKLQHNDGHTSVTNFNNWLRRVAHNFLMKYSQYLQQEVGFYSVPILNSQVTQNRREHTTKLNVKYALFRRSIHLAGVHIIEVSVLIVSSCFSVYFRKQFKRNLLLKLYENFFILYIVEFFQKN